MSDKARDLRPVFDSPDYLRAARSVADFVDSVSIEEGSGLTWPLLINDGTQPGNATSALSTTNTSIFFAGNAGLVFYYTQLYTATGDEQYLDRAQRGALYIIEHYRDEVPQTPFEALNGLTSSYFVGFASVVFALIELNKVAASTQLEATARNLIQDIIDAVQDTPQGKLWSEFPGIIGDSSTVLTLLHAADALNEPAWADLAIEVAESILASGEQRSNGLRFNGSYTERLDLLDFKDVEIPNFEFGTAGIAYTLARVYEVSRDERFLAAAIEGARYLRSIAVYHDGRDGIGDGALIPYRFPDQPDVFYLGYCHGPAGTGRLFYKLYEITGDRQHLDFLEQLVNGIELTGAPENHSTGYWHNFTLCCGTAGQINFFLGLWAATGESRYLELANRGGKHVLGEAGSFDDDKGGLRWYQAFERINPANVTLEVSYWSGTAGIGAALLWLHQANTNNFKILRTPDDPFPPELPHA